MMVGTYGGFWRRRSLPIGLAQHLFEHDMCLGAGTSTRCRLGWKLQRGHRHGEARYLVWLGEIRPTKQTWGLECRSFLAAKLRMSGRQILLLSDI